MIHIQQMKRIELRLKLSIISSNYGNNIKDVLIDLKQYCFTTKHRERVKFFYYLRANFIKTWLR